MVGILEVKKDSTYWFPTLLLYFVIHLHAIGSLFLCFILSHPANLQSQVKKGRMTQEKFEKTISLLKGVLDYESFKDVDMVIEVLLEHVAFIHIFYFL